MSGWHAERRQAPSLAASAASGALTTVGLGLAGHPVFAAVSATLTGAALVALGVAARR